MSMQTPKDLFIHELQDMYDAEQRILQTLPKLASECTDQQVTSAFQQHEQETRQHVQNLEKVFGILNASPQGAPCLGVQGLIGEHQAFLKESPSPEVLTMFDIGAGTKTEAYEIASYTGLVEKANLMGQTQVAQLLAQNLEQEKSMKQRLKEIGKQIGQRQIKQTAGAFV